MKGRAQELAHELAAGPRIGMAGIMDAVQSALDNFSVGEKRDPVFE